MPPDPHSLVSFSFLCAPTVTGDADGDPDGDGPGDGAGQPRDAGLGGGEHVAGGDEHGAEAVPRQAAAQLQHRVPVAQGVKCNDVGVRTVDARASVTLDEWLATATADDEMDLAYFEPMGSEAYIWSPFYVQVPTNLILILPFNASWP